MWVVIITAFAAVVNIGLLYRYVSDTARIVRASAAQVDLSASQLEQMDRAWLKVDATIDQFNIKQIPYFGKQSRTEMHQRLDARMVISIQNVGHTVATRVFLNMDTVAAPLVFGMPYDLMSKAVAEQKLLCDHPAGMKLTAPMLMGKPAPRILPDIDWSIFPNDVSPVETTMDLSFEEIAAAREQTNPNLRPNLPNYRAVLPMTVGCVDYFYGSTGKSHQTLFIFAASRSASGYTPYRPLPFNLDEIDHVPVSGIRLDKYVSAR